MGKRIEFVAKAARVMHPMPLSSTTAPLPLRASLPQVCLTCQHTRSFASRSLQKPRPAPKLRQRAIPRPQPQIPNAPQDTKSGIIPTDFSVSIFQDILDNNQAPLPNISAEELYRRVLLFIDGVRAYEPVAIINKVTLSAVPGLTAKDLHELALSCQPVPQTGFNVTPGAIEVCARSGYGPSVLSSVWLRLQTKQGEVPSGHVARLEQMARERVPDAQTLLALFHKQMKQFTQARTLLQRALQNEPNDETLAFELRDHARCSLAEVYSELGDQAKADEIIEELKGLDTTDPRLFPIMAKLLYRKDTEQTKKYIYARALSRRSSPTPTLRLAKLELEAMESITQDAKLKKWHELWAYEWTELAEDSERLAGELSKQKPASSAVES